MAPWPGRRLARLPAPVSSVSVHSEWISRCCVHSQTGWQQMVWPGAPELPLQPGALNCPQTGVACSRSPRRIGCGARVVGSGPWPEGS